MPVWAEAKNKWYTECSLVTGVEVQVGGANLYKRRVITSCSHDNEAAHMIVWLLVSRRDHVHHYIILDDSIITMKTTHV